MSATADSGIIWESEGSVIDAGTAVFDSFEAREEAKRVLRYFGYDYLMDFKEVKGPGLSWGHYLPDRVTPERRRRLPSFQRAQREQEARGRMNAAMVGNPGYDLMRDPRPC